MPPIDASYRWRPGDVFERASGYSRWIVDLVSLDGNRAVLRSLGTSWATTNPLTVDEWNEDGQWLLADVPTVPLGVSTDAHASLSPSAEYVSESESPSHDAAYWAGSESPSVSPSISPSMSPSPSDGLDDYSPSDPTPTVPADRRKRKYRED